MRGDQRDETRQPHETRGVSETPHARVIVRGDREGGRGDTTRFHEKPSTESSEDSKEGKGSEIYSRTRFAAGPRKERRFDLEQAIGRILPDCVESNLRYYSVPSPATKAALFSSSVLVMGIVSTTKSAS